LKTGDYLQNVEGTGNDKPDGGGSWKKMYEDVHEWPTKCRIRYCEEPANGGGHVTVRGKGRNVYIVPMCDRKHNTAQNDEWLPAKKSTIALLIHEEKEKKKEETSIDIPEGQGIDIPEGQGIDIPEGQGIDIPGAQGIETKKPAGWFSSCVIV
jgi:hypothetical protein